MKPGDLTPELIPLVNAALKTGNSKPLEAYIRRRVTEGHEDTVLGDFGRLIGEMCTQPNPPVKAVEKLLDEWAERSPATNYVQIAAAVNAYMHVAALRPDWWDDELRKIRQAARIKEPLVASMVETAIVWLMAKDLERGAVELANWHKDKNPMVQYRAQRIVQMLKNIADNPPSREYEV
jgi:hypothetical protein